MKKETIKIDGKTFFKTSHDVYKIKQVSTGNIYDEAIDVVETEYELTNIEKREKGDEK